MFLFILILQEEGRSLVNMNPDKASVPEASSMDEDAPTGGGSKKDTSGCSPQGDSSGPATTKDAPKKPHFTPSCPPPVPTKKEQEDASKRLSQQPKWKEEHSKRKPYSESELLKEFDKK